MTRADAALRLAQRLGIAHNDSSEHLHGLFPGVFPGGYEGVRDLAYADRPATLEHVLVALVRWAGWDTVHYDAALETVVAPHVSPEGFPFYGPDPTPRSIPYVIVALSQGLLPREALPTLRSPVSPETLDAYCDRIQALKRAPRDLPVLSLGASRPAEALRQRQSDRQLLLLQSGFVEHGLLSGMRNPLLDLSGPGLRLYTPGSSFAGGRQDYFPLGPLDTQLSVGSFVPANSYSHQAQAILGLVENESDTVNAVGMWASARSLRKGARVWGSFIDVNSAHGPEQDAQVIGLEVDVSNHTLPGMAPHRSKVGVQIVGLGEAPVSSAIEILSDGGGQWVTGIGLSPNSIHPEGAVMSIAGPAELARGIDLNQVLFKDGALLVSIGSPVSFASKTGEPSLIYTDDMRQGMLVLKAGPSGIRFVKNADASELVEFRPDGNIVTPVGNFKRAVRDILILKVAVALLLVVVIVQGVMLRRRRPSM
jgi:hypothetical protein